MFVSGLQYIDDSIRHLLRILHRYQISVDPIFDIVLCAPAASGDYRASTGRGFKTWHGQSFGDGRHNPAISAFVDAWNIILGRLIVISEICRNLMLSLYPTDTKAHHTCLRQGHR